MKTLRKSDSCFPVQLPVILACSLVTMTWLLQMISADYSALYLVTHTHKKKTLIRLKDGNMSVMWTDPQANNRITGGIFCHYWHYVIKHDPAQVVRPAIFPVLRDFQSVSVWWKWGRQQHRGQRGRRESILALRWG